jgi:hypothetical protein
VRLRLLALRIFVHATFLFLVAWFAVAYWFEVGSLARVASRQQP